MIAITSGTPAAKARFNTAAQASVA